MKNTNINLVRNPSEVITYRDVLMRTRRRTYTAATPSSLFPISLTATHTVQSCTPNPRRNLEQKKKKCIKNWDINIPSDLLREILSRLGLKANIQASAVCKTWFGAAVSVRKLKPRPWPFYPPRGSKKGTYVLLDTLRSQTYTQNFPELEYPFFCYSRDGWLLVRTFYPWAFFLLNPFTRECTYLPKESGFVSAFSGAPTSSSCLVISLVQQSEYSSIEIKTWRPGATVWTTHCFENQPPKRSWVKCVLSNGMFYCLSTDGYLGVFDPSRATWNILKVKPWPSFRYLEFLSLMEHEGDIFVIHMYWDDNYPPVFKLNLKRKVWEEKRDLGGLTVFARHSGSLTRAGLSAEERNRIYHYAFEEHGLCYYSQGDDKSSHPPSTPSLSHHVAWVDPPHNFNL